MSGTIHGSPWSIVDGDDGGGSRKVLIFTNGDGDIFINRGGLHLRILSYRLGLTNMVWLDKIITGIINTRFTHIHQTEKTSNKFQFHLKTQNFLQFGEIFKTSELLKQKSNWGKEKGGGKGGGCQLNLFFKILETHSWIKYQLNLIKTGTTPFSRLRSLPQYNCPVLIWGLLNTILTKQRGDLIILWTLIIFYQHCITPNLTGCRNYL